MKNVEDIYPLAPMQQGMLFHTLLDSQAGAYFEQVGCMLEGGLDVTAFRQAWQRVIERHTVLRTAFAWEDLNQPLQIVRQEVPLPWTEHDWRGLTFDQQEREWERLLQDDRTQGFTLTRAPLLRLALARVGETAYRFLWSHHHLLLDGWSVPLVYKDVFAFYQASRQGRHLQLPRVRPYRDYVAWLQRQDLRRAEDFWKRTLQGFYTPTPIGFLRGSVAVHSTQKYGAEEVRLTAALTSHLESFARSQQVTLNNVLQGAWALLLSRYSSQEDIIFGTVVSGRPPALPGVEEMVGLFLNTLPFRVCLPASAQLGPWLRENQSRHAALREFEYSSLVQVQAWSDVPRGNRLFHSLFVFENYPLAGSLPEDACGLKVRAVRYGERTGYPLLVVAMPGPEIDLRLVYDGDVLDAAAARRILGHFQVVLESFAINPGQSLGDVPMLSPRELHQLLVTWNGIRTDYAPDRCIHELFERQVGRNPASVAVVCEDRQLTYRELNAQANRLAHYLRSLGVGPETRVGIYLERSPEMVVGLLAVLKAGGAYVPLDPTNPKGRLSTLLEDTGAHVVLCQRSLRDDLERLEQRLSVFCFDTCRQAIEGYSPEDLPSVTRPDNLAYVIYTSGSAGSPKGVMVTHRSLAGAYRAWEAAYALGRDTFCHLQMANFAFDVFTGDWVRALCSGGKLVLCPQYYLLNSPRLYELMRSEKVDCAEFVPAVVRPLLEYLRQSRRELSFLRLLAVGSDVWYQEEYEQLRRVAGPATRVVNSYGLTEATIDSLFYEAAQPIVPASRSVPIGKPFANTQVYVLDTYLRPVAVGVPGELYVGGSGVARGYLNRPGLTAERFVPDPFSGLPGARLYRTGDYVCWLPDGNLEFLGRLDHQVKVRGCRVELGEVETVLLRHSAVQEVVVLAKNTSLGDKSLVAYVVPAAVRTLNLSELRSYLQEQLPGQLVPSTLVPLEALPRTANGKVDRRALSDPGAPQPAPNQAYVAPRTPEEEALARVWASVLGVKRIGIHDNFFDLGGHSLLALQLMVRLEQEFEIRFPLASLFRAPTVAQFAHHVRPADSDHLTSLVPIQPGGSRPPLFFVHPAGGSIFCYVELARQLGPDQPFYGFQGRGIDDDQEPHHTVGVMAAEYVQALRSARPQGPYLLGGWSLGGVVAFEMARRLEALGEKVSLLVLLDAPVPGTKQRLSELEETVLVSDFLRNLGLPIDDTGSSLEHLVRLGPEACIAYVLEQTHGTNLLPPGFRWEQARRYFEVFQAHAQALADYRPSGRCRRITLLQASERLGEAAVCDQEEWRRWAAEFEHWLAPGDHYSMLQPPHVRALVERLRSYLPETGQVSETALSAGPVEAGDLHPALLSGRIGR